MSEMRDMKEIKEWIYSKVDTKEDKEFADLLYETFQILGDVSAYFLAHGDEQTISTVYLSKLLQGKQWDWIAYYLGKGNEKRKESGETRISKNSLFAYTE